MKNLNVGSLSPLSEGAKQSVRGGNAIIVALGIGSSIIAIGMAADQAAAWFIDGWKNPK